MSSDTQPYDLSDDEELVDDMERYRDRCGTPPDHGGAGYTADHEGEVLQGPHVTIPGIIKNRLVWQPRQANWDSMESDDNEREDGPSGTSTNVPSSPPKMPLVTPVELSSRAHGTLRVPLEVLERIIRYAILPQGELTPLSEPPLGRSTLLLVSHAIHDLALPLLYDTIWIDRPSQYAALFDPESGVLVSGEAGTKRWGMVRQIAIQTPTAPPAAGNNMVPLTSIPGHTLERLCLPDPLIIDSDQNIAGSRRDRAGAGFKISQLKEQADSELPGRLKRAKIPPKPPTVSQPIHQERQRFLARLLGNARPREMHISAGALLCVDFARPGRACDGAQVVVHRSWFSPFDGDAFYRAMDLQQTLGSGPIHFRGFDATSFTRFEQWATSGKPMPDGPGTTMDIKRVKKWVFVMDDGERRSLPERD